MNDQKRDTLTRCVSIAILLFNLNGCGLVGSANLQQHPMPLEQRRVDFVIGNVEFALLHELAHLAIAETQIPIIGPEEQAADYIATISLLRPTEVPPIGGERWLEFAVTAGDAFLTLWQLGEFVGASSPYWDSHALSIQRFYTIGCLLYGSNPSRFEAIPSQIGMPPQRAQSCEAEYRRATQSIDWALATFGRQQGVPPLGALSVRFDAPRTRVSEYLVKELQDSRLVDWTVMRLEDLISLGADATVVFRACSRPEAAWLPEDRELVVCYELLDLYYALSSAANERTIESFR
jgi:hypothetical protein